MRGSRRARRALGAPHPRVCACCVLVEVPLLKYTRKPSDIHLLRVDRPSLQPDLYAHRARIVPLSASYVYPPIFARILGFGQHPPHPQSDRSDTQPSSAKRTTAHHGLQASRRSEVVRGRRHSARRDREEVVQVGLHHHQQGVRREGQEGPGKTAGPSARNPPPNRPLFYRRTANHLSRREARLKTYTMLSLLAATPALRCPAPMMQTGQGEMTPVGSAPGWAARRGGRFSGGVVPTTSAMATSAMAIHEATRDAEPNVGNYLAPHTAPGAQAPSAESNPQVYSKWLATRNDGGAGVEGALAERAMAEQTAAHLAALRADERAVAERAELDRVEAVRAASERASAERHALATEQKAMADREAADRVAAGRAAAANMHAQRAAKAAEEQAMADQAFAARQAAGKAAAAAWIRGRAP